MQNLEQHEFLRLHGPKFTLFMEIEVDLKDSEDLQDRLDLLDAFRVQPNLELYRHKPYPAANGRSSKLGSFHLLWLLDHSVIWHGRMREVECADGRSRPNSAWTFYLDVWNKLNELFGGDAGFKISATRNPFCLREDAEYVTHCIHRERTSLLDLKRAASRALRERDEIQRVREDLERVSADDAKKSRGSKGHKRAQWGRSGALTIDGKNVLPPLVDKDGIIQRNDSCFDVARFHGYALAEQIKAEGRVPQNAEIERSVFEVAWEYNQLIPQMTELRPSLAKGDELKGQPLPRREIEQTAKSVASYVLLTFFSEDARASGNERIGRRRYRINPSDYTPEQRVFGGEQRQKAIGARKHQAEAGRASGQARKVPRRKINRVKKMLREGTRPAEIKRRLDASPRTVDRYIAQAREELLREDKE